MDNETKRTAIHGYLGVLTIAGYVAGYWIGDGFFEIVGLWVSICAIGALVLFVPVLILIPPVLLSALLERIASRLSTYETIDGYQEALERGDMRARVLMRSSRTSTKINNLCQRYTQTVVERLYPTTLF